MIRIVPYFQLLHHHHHHQRKRRRLYQLGLLIFFSHHHPSSLSSVRSFTFANTSSSSYSHTTQPSAATAAVKSFSSLFAASTSNSLSGIFGFRSSSSPKRTMSTSSTTTFSLDEPSSPAAVHTTMVIGKKKILQDLIMNNKTTTEDSLLLFNLIDSTTAQAVLDSIDNGSSGAASTFINSGQQKFVLGIIPDETTRYNHAWSVHSVTEMVTTHLPAGGVEKPSRIIFVGDSSVENVGALTIAIARAFPVFSEKTTSASRKNDAEKMQQELSKKQRMIHINFYNDQGDSLDSVLDTETKTAVMAAADGVQLAARLVDMPPDQLTTDAYAAECQALATSLGSSVTFMEIKGDELHKRGYGGIYNVGKAATCPPRLVIMEYTPPSSPTNNNDNNNDDRDASSKVIALVGKSIVYDTGGLALKTREGMCGMKADMGGSAGLLGAFVSAIRSGSYPHKKLILILCMAENAIGPTAFRNDDILRLYSGKTVEINNSDAEGRLVLGDGVAHATKHIPNLDLVIDMATLTGAQMICTGKKHAAILSNKHEIEVQAVEAGLRSGELCYPMLYAPELLIKEFKSKVADMKNSVKDRSNAQASCAGHFIEAHLDEDYKGGWLHVDMAGPAWEGERGTGYGVGLVLSLLGVKGF